MVRFTDFISLRSSSGLLRKGRIEAVKLAHNLNKLDKIFDSLKGNNKLIQEIRKVKNDFDIVNKEKNKICMQKVSEFETLIKSVEKIPKSKKITTVIKELKVTDEKLIEDIEYILGHIRSADRNLSKLLHLLNRLHDALEGKKEEK